MDDDIKIELMEHPSTGSAEVDCISKKLEDTLKELDKCERMNVRLTTYNKELIEQLKVLSEELHNFKQAANNKVDIGIQVDQADLQSAGMPTASDWGEATANGEISSIADSLTAAATAAVQQSGYVYDSASGMYYDYNTGYYYDNERSLYYDPTQGIYYYFDETTQQYEVHSQVDVSCYYNTDLLDSVAAPTQESLNLPDTQANIQANPKSNVSVKTKTMGFCKKHPNNSASKCAGDLRGCGVKSTVRRDVMPSEEMEDLEAGGERGSICGNSRRERIARGDGVNQKEWSPRGDGDSGRECTATSDGDTASKNRRLGSCDCLDGNGEMDIDDGIIDGILLNTESNVVPRGTSCDWGEESGRRGEFMLIAHSSCKSREREESPHSGSSHDSGEAGVSDDAGSDVACTCDTRDEDDDAVNPANYPPCIRLIVRSSDVVDPGNLYIITYHGGTIGRDDPVHSVCLPDASLHQTHAEISYDESRKSYLICPSTNDCLTLVNSVPVTVPHDIGHGDVVTVGCTDLLLHIHPGIETCDDCEPGEVQARLKAARPKQVVIESKEDKKLEMRRQKKKLMKKYGLANSAYEHFNPSVVKPQYSDRASERRKLVGSDAPLNKTVSLASVSRPLGAENKGRQMLERLGWSDGTGLGRARDGLVEPVRVGLRPDERRGFGSQDVTTSLDDVNLKSTRTAQNWAKTRRRYEQIEECNDETKMWEKGDINTDDKPQKTWVKGPTQTFS